MAQAQDSAAGPADGRSRRLARLEPKRDARAQRTAGAVSLVRRDGALAKSDIARITGLSAQTVSVIMRSAGGGRPAAAGRAGAGQDRPAVGADVAGGGRGLLSSG